MESADITISQLCQKAVQSEVFITQVLKGEDGLGRLVNIDLLQSIADATGRTLTIKIKPSVSGIRKNTVKGGQK